MIKNDLKQALVERLIGEFELKEQGDFLRRGICPSCGKKELYTLIEHPWQVKCGRLNNCGYEESSKTLCPELYADLNKKYEPTAKNPTATADAYMELHRGFNAGMLRGAYAQGSFYSARASQGTQTVKFWINRATDVYMERFVETINIPQDDGSRIPRSQNFNGSFRGLFWNNPLQTLKDNDTVYITEACIDAISLQQKGFKAVAALTCSNYPIKSIAKHDPNKTIEWVWALDGDKAGRKGIIKHFRAMKKDNYIVAAAVPPQGQKKQDWNDLYKADKINQESMDEYRYQGDLLVADNAMAKALLVWNKKNINGFPLNFDQRTFWFNLDLDKFTKALERIQEQNDAFEITEDQQREQAAKNSGGLVEIANCQVNFLYFQRNDLTDESWYYAQVDFPHRGRSIKNTFTGSQVSGGGDFKKRLISIAPGALFTGRSEQLDRIVKHQLYNIKTVDTIDFIGYCKEHQCYVLGNKMVTSGQLYDINDEDYFEWGNTSLKTLAKSPELHIAPAHKYNEDWVQDVWGSFGAKGLVVLTYWFASLFCEQVRKKQKSFPFLELVGEPGAGKSTLIEFMWRLFGRIDHEGFDPVKATAAARARNLAQVGGMPVVMIEGDRGSDTASSKSMDWDETKSLYNGRSPRSRGMKNSGNETYEPPFRGALVISQNATVDGEPAVLERIVHVSFTKDGHNADTRIASERLNARSLEEVSYFMVKAALSEKKTMEYLEQKQPIYEKKLLAMEDVKHGRIAKNHAQVMAFADALAELVGLSKEQRDATLVELADMAVARKHAISADHPIVAQFWETFYYLNEATATAKTLAEKTDYQYKNNTAAEFALTAEDEPADFEAEYKPGLNHSRDKQLIAVHLNEYVSAAGEHKQQIPLYAELKKLLKGSRSHKFLAIKTVNSVITGKAKKCWVFEKRTSK